MAARRHAGYLSNHSLLYPGDCQNNTFIVPVMRLVLLKYQEQLPLAIYVPSFGRASLDEEFAQLTASDEFQAFIKQQIYPGMKQYQASLCVPRLLSVTSDRLTPSSHLPLPPPPPPPPIFVPTPFSVCFSSVTPPLSNIPLPFAWKRYILLQFRVYGQIQCPSTSFSSPLFSSFAHPPFPLSHFKPCIRLTAWGCTRLPLLHSPFPLNLSCCSPAATPHHPTHPPFLLPGPLRPFCLPLIAPHPFPLTSFPFPPLCSKTSRKHAFWRHFCGQRPSPGPCISVKVENFISSVEVNALLVSIEAKSVLSFLKASYPFKNSRLGFAISCSNRWLKIEVTAR